MRVVARSIAICCLLFTGACASIVEGTDQTVTVITDPAGATCQLKRDGAIVAIANPTPTSVVVGKSKDNISVECEKPGHQRGAASLASSFEGMTFGNILLGGFIGVGIDAASGAMHEYPANVTVILPPESFDSLSDRDVFFDRQVARIRSEAAQAITKVNNTCNANGEPERCKAAVDAIETERQARLDANEAMRQASVIR